MAFWDLLLYYFLILEGPGLEGELQLGSTSPLDSLWLSTPVFREWGRPQRHG